MSIRMSTIKFNTGCICLRHLVSNAWSLEENNGCPLQENSRSECTCYCSVIIRAIFRCIVLSISKFSWLSSILANKCKSIWAWVCLCRSGKFGVWSRSHSITSSARYCTTAWTIVNWLQQSNTGGCCRSFEVKNVI